MLPLTFDPAKVIIGLAGQGEGYQRRIALLTGSGIAPVEISDPDTLPAGIQILFVSGLDHDVAAAFASAGKSIGALVNVEDVPELCDFHVPAIVRRDDLLLTISTSGSAPGFARMMREWLEKLVGPEWGERVREIATHRHAWRDAGHTPAEVSARTRSFVSERQWLR